MELEPNTEIKSVTIYPDRAVITIQATISMVAGTHRVIFDELPLVLDQDSVRARGQGEMSIRLLGVDVSTIYYEETPAEDVGLLLDQIHAIEDSMKELDDESESHLAHSEYISGLRRAADRFAQGLSRGKSTVENQIELTNFLYEQDRETKAALRKIIFDRRELKAKLTKLRQELKEKQSSSRKKRMRAVVGLETDIGGEAALELTYLVSKAGWKPLYDLRLTGEAGRSLVELTAFAEISQETGQEWKNVELYVSTARPAIAQRKPELDPWYIDVYTPPSPRVYGASHAMPRPAAAAEPAPKSQAMRLGSLEDDLILAEMVVAEVASRESAAVGSSVTFKIKGQADIPSDGSTHKKVIATHQLDPEIDYLAVPKHTSAVFRRILMINESPAPLLAGKSNLFAHDEFIGSTDLDYVPIGGEVEMLFGVEERIRIERELIKRDVDKARLRDKRQIRFGFEIEIENLMPDEVNVELQDQLPVSRHEDIKVRLEKGDPEPSEISELNIIEWKLLVNSGETQNIEFAYLVEHPRNIRVSGLEMA